MITLEILKISNFSDGEISAIVKETGDKVICYLQNKERDWDKLYNYLTKPMKVRVNIMTTNYLLIMEIID